MKSIVNNVVKIMATGFVVLTLLSLLLFWVRFACERSLISRLPEEAKCVSIRASHLFLRELQYDPNVIQQSCISARMSPEKLSLLGIVSFFATGLSVPGAERDGDTYFIKSRQDLVYFDRRIGQVVCHYTRKETMPDKTVLPRKVQLYAGPEGISETADKALRRFVSPIIDPRRMDPLILYDQKLRRFFRINFNNKTIVKGPELDRHDSREPVQIGQISKIWPRLSLNWVGPQALARAKDERRDWYTPSDLQSAIQKKELDESGEYLLVLDGSGRIDLLNRETLEFARRAGYLPAVETFFPSKPHVTPDDLLAYEVMPLAFRTDGKYGGMAIASVCREGSAIKLAAFDKKGKLIIETWNMRVATEYRRSEEHILPSRYVRLSKAFFFGVPWAPALTIAKFLLENLQPPILSLVSYFTAYSFEAGAGHRALFILPNSFVAMKGRDVRQDALSRLGYAVLLMLPSLMLGIFLAWRIEKDGTVVGLPKSARLCWMIGTIAFGLAGYITYRLTRPKETLVTCTNCGKLRRPDMDRCHRCGSRWHVPQITPPAWRVVDNV